MEPDQFDIETSLMGFAVLSAIPAVFFALWLDYFERDIEQLKIEEPNFNKAQEVEKTRMACLLSMLLQLTFFLGFSDVRQAYPGTVSFIFMTSLIFEIYLQVKAEKLIDLPSPSNPILKIIFRAILSWLIGVAFYLSTLVIALKVSLLIAEFSQVSKTMGAVFLLLGGMIGSLLGFGFNFILSPFHLKKILPAQPLSDPLLAKRLEACFQKAGVKSPDFYIINLDPIPVNTLLLAGIQHGKGILRQTFFISNSCMQVLNPAEFDALVLNHASHLTLKHFQKRLLLSIFLLVTTLVMAVGAVLLMPHLGIAQTSYESVGPIVALSLFFCSLLILNRQTKNQELESDLYTVNQLGVSLNELTSALQKADHGHPETEKRIQRIQTQISKIKTIAVESEQQKAA